MLKNYKKSYLVINIILTLLFVFLCLNLWIFKQTSYLSLIITVLVPTALIICLYGYEIKSRRFKYELSFYVLIYVIAFLLITYLLGLFLGFTSNVYKLNFTNLIHNIIPYIILIFVCEILRYEISRKGDGSTFSYIIITVILTLVDISLFRSTYDLTTGDGQIKYMCVIVVPNAFKNVVLLYFTKHGGVYPSLIYRLVLDLKLVIVPIFPNFGPYFECIINTTLPVLMAFIIHFNLKKFEDEHENIDVKGSKKFKYIVLAVILSIVIFINILVSCTLKFNMIAIGSNSMVPVFSKGDAVIYERVNRDKELKVGQIIVFKKDKKTIVHRLIEIVDIGNGEFVYYTKGDANADPDGYPIERGSIMGVYKASIKYIGFPSVALGELINK